MICPCCGKETPDDNVCIFCGTQLKPAAGTGSRLIGSATGRTQPESPGTGPVQGSAQDSEQDLIFNKGQNSMKSEDSSDVSRRNSMIEGGKEEQLKGQNSLITDKKITDSGKKQNSLVETEPGNDHDKDKKPRYNKALIIILTAILAGSAVGAGISMLLSDPGESTGPVGSRTEVYEPSDTPGPTAVITPAPTPRPTPAPGPTPTPAPPAGPGVKDMMGAEAWIEVPQNGSWLRESEYKEVMARYGIKIYLYYGPGEASEHFDTVNDGESVTVLAREQDKSLVIASGNRVGWCSTSLLTDYNYAVDSMPLFDELCLRYYNELDESTDFSIMFYSDGSYTAFDNINWTYSEGSFEVTGRRVKIDGRLYFVWDGYSFRYIHPDGWTPDMGEEHLDFAPEDGSYFSTCGR